MYVFLFKCIVALHAILVPVCVYLIWNFNYWSKRGLRTALPITIFGTYPSLLTGRRNMVYDIHDVYLKYKRNNRAIGVFVTRRPEILILDPQLAHDILVPSFRQYHDTITSSWINNRKLDRFAICNPFWASGEEWKVRRNDALAGITANKLKLAYEIWQASCKKMLKYLEEKSDNGVVETRDLSNRFTADVMGDFIWGIDAGTFTNADKPNIFVQMTEKWLDHTYKTRMYSLRSALFPVIRKIYPFRLFHKETDAFFSQLTQDAIDLRTKVKPDPARPDFLNYMLKLRERKTISHDDIVGYALTILLDGYETNAITLMHTLFYLAKYPHVQTKLRAEVMANFSESDGGISFDNLDQMNYMEQCINETLRLITLLPNFSRICTEPTSLQISPERSIAVPKGTVLTIPTFSFHHDEEYFAEPNVYIPERFDNAAHSDLTKRGIFLPFGDGPRICMGMRVAVMTVKIALSEILAHFEVRNCAFTQNEQNPNVKSFVLGLEGDIMLEYKRL